ncbi:MAG: NAD(P)H-dependent oxidoreductase [Nanoarchaeota archaeon]|nr:NAD(P)H-dependent oxidoreductase [Nanoarchaeota archaeon]
MLWGCQKRGECLYDRSKKPIKIVGIMSSKRAKSACAREDPTSNELLKISLKEAEKKGAKIEIIDLRELEIGACKECYSTCPAQCRFNEKLNQCDCYWLKQDTLFLNNGEVWPLEEAYDKLTKKEFFEFYHSEGNMERKDDMWKVYKALMGADGIIFSTSTNFYGRPALLQTMLSRFCALDGGVEENWGDGKNLNNSIKYSKKKNSVYKQRLFGKHVAFINVSKEGDSVTPNLMKACTMMGMKTIPLGVSYGINWYNDRTHRSDKKKVLNDKYTVGLAKYIGQQIIKEIKMSDRIYGKASQTV